MTVRSLWRRWWHRAARPPTGVQLNLLLPVLDRAAELAPVADGAVRACGAPGDVPGHVGRTCGELVTAYQQLRTELRDIPAEGALRGTADEIDRLLHYHQWLVRSALQLAFSLNPDPRTEAMRRRLDGLGPSATRLDALRADVARQLDASTARRTTDAGHDGDHADRDRAAPPMGPSPEEGGR
ncbi:hypothetical protein [Amycolatopsis nalaikhensis]|uniref:Uncharacterized protein n=1 Tax=Amycolatopsis nalaikhensis TaxID=715472 RepID=A0ABY8XTX6_9PSEU|nr:hypothetical protein [Amycolatopsis sp. 2-2]WIV59145.1 hypothetical protein QP939_11200 [Amycolatopsis sp. 2-2]